MPFKARAQSLDGEVPDDENEPHLHTNSERVLRMLGPHQPSSSLRVFSQARVVQGLELAASEIAQAIEVARLTESGAVDADVLGAPWSGQATPSHRVISADASRIQIVIGEFFSISQLV